MDSEDGRKNELKKKTSSREKNTKQVASACAINIGNKYQENIKKVVFIWS
jgi:hypothetical protein